ncbi:beta-carotene 15,15'-monooxygenase, Brp/Blh family [Cyclonatronum proteinivorum]|uniref:Probable beta-carotene 15,15'-dioxygenase n=1 Tax=Cyclonatronum proteinivorum TaxID=1457365 RepID=A0A345UGT7_9BACT|nr:Brp/Blh family beta-carotene 15,15'-dioxygenase [Cyclonatronum proteinivorum]AXI99688.1 beta-carotene 15,15'-monooxygenase, Brp/Blh family [Cyclonatronum proteinivorum]
MNFTLWNAAVLPAAFVIVVLHLLLPGAGFWVGTVFALAGLILFGIPHGSLDHVITEKTGDGSFSLIRFLVLYLLTMLVYALFWVWLPAFSLLFFLLMSAWHFGETDLVTENPKQTFSDIAARFLQLTYGSLLLFGLLANDPQQTVDILSSLLVESSVLAGFLQLTETHSWLRFTEFYALGLRILLIRSAWFDQLRLALVLFAALFLPLLEGFLLYFCHHHAWVNLLRVKEKLYEAGQTGLRHMIKDMLPFSLISVVGIVILVLSAPLWLAQVNPVLLFFILISVLTLPHAGIMTRFYYKAAG